VSDIIYLAPIIALLQVLPIFFQAGVFAAVALQ
jgi:hypothetical protein